MLIPLRTDRPPRRKPIVTESIMVANLLVYLAGLAAEVGGLFDLDAMVNVGHAGRTEFHLWQLITYQFLHDPGSIWHLAFNMLFLWIFGCAVEDRVGRMSFLMFYLMGGAVAGIAHMMVSPNPVIGASGSIAAVTGAFLALFPRSRIKILFFFFFIGIYTIPSLWFIGFYFALDVLKQLSGILGATQGPVAYSAHIAGYLYGFGTAFLLLATNVVKREEFDVFFLFKQARRRAAFRAAGRSQTGGMWESASADTARQLAKAKKKATPPSQEEQRLAAARAEIAQLISQHKLSDAAAKYAALLDETPEAVLAERPQLDLANQLHAQGDHARAALAYELLLHHYPKCDNAAEIRLLLAVIFTRHLKQPDRARPFLEQAKASLRDEGQKALADQLQAELDS
ncbi:MAG: rhomboid family intramembrane serine protease [Phycisphaerales bacterium]|nr:MAG: rhomboid family intramembrane serine protease [Phycisphaerales bacterium]